MDCPAQIESPDAFTKALEAILEEAHENDVPVEGGWFIESADDDRPVWDVEIWTVERSNDASQ